MKAKTKSTESDQKLVLLPLLATSGSTGYILQDLAHNPHWNDVCTTPKYLIWRYLIISKSHLISPPNICRLSKDSQNYMITNEVTVVMKHDLVFLMIFLDS